MTFAAFDHRLSDRYLPILPQPVSLSQTPSPCWVLGTPILRQGIHTPRRILLHLGNLKLPASGTTLEFKALQP